MAESAEKKSIKFNVVGQYAKDVSFECPVPSFVKDAENLKLHMDVQLGTRHLQENLHETVLRLKVEAKNDKDVSCYISEIDYVGVYQIEGAEAEQLQALLNVDGATILYPFARQLVMSLITEAGYRAPQLAPMNFAAMYAQNQKAQQEAATDSKKETKKKAK